MPWVIEIKYDSIRKKTISVVLGDFTAQYFDKVSSSVNRIDHAIRPNGSVVAEQIEGIINAMKASLRFQNTVAQKQEVRAVLFEDLDPESELYGALSIGIKRTRGLQTRERQTDVIGSGRRHSQQKADMQTYLNLARFWPHLFMEVP